MCSTQGAELILWGALESAVIRIINLFVSSVMFVVFDNKNPYYFQVQIHSVSFL